MSRQPVSAAIITLNEEVHIVEAVRSVSFCDEVIVVDCGSEDRTVALAEAEGARVIHHDWPGHIEQKNFAIDQTQHPWVLSIDADERVTPKLKESILQALENPDRSAYRMPRRSNYMGRWIGHCGWYPDRKVRLFDKTRARWGGVNPHDKVVTQGEVGDLAGDLQHYPYRDLSHHLRQIDSYTTIAANEKRKKGKRAGWANLALQPPATFLKKFILQRGFLDGWQGLLISASASWYVRVKYAKLRELERAEAKGRR